MSTSKYELRRSSLRHASRTNRKAAAPEISPKSNAAPAVSLWMKGPSCLMFLTLPVTIISSWMM
ncbi:hypothetical protein EYF80_052031 [Liparis tanakae]|uniref:Uncharacterized protein n=1 Tax=Liparis tanakae TaxID=230148 RepID=A0A4Z2F9D2_9TELE|nr:hypothetical protein EYF80_052031 [Liparis tanakae]